MSYSLSYFAPIKGYLHEIFIVPKSWPIEEKTRKEENGERRTVLSCFFYLAYLGYYTANYYILKYPIVFF